MSPFDWNKLFGAFLATCLFMLIVNDISKAFFAGESDAGGKPYAYTPSNMEVASSSAPVEVILPLPALLAKAEIDHGKKVAKKCKSCHTFAKDGGHKVGPNLWDIVEKAIAGKGGFVYSGALSELSQQPWDYASLDAFLLKPAQFAKGTKMSFAGIKKPEDRAALILYLRSLSDSPAPLPAP